VKERLPSRQMALINFFMVLAPVVWGDRGYFLAA